MINPAALVLADGSIFRGESVGAEGEVVGQLIFYRGAAGYQEVLTDQSYADRIVTFTTSHLGNTGINRQDYRSESVTAAAVVMRTLALRTSHFRSEISLADYLRRQNIIAISEIDTRELSQRALLDSSLWSSIITGHYSDKELRLRAQQLFQQQGIGISRDLMKEAVSTTDSILHPLGA
ncbi:carbamoyl-phosphate synthase domain-containing protein [Ignatzschineria cameli]|uniref:Carbamoyl-phosphate synthase small subunit N-terminal domain-containing protein n=1 Tax=Ignatzschineria cameli TaxID=2182793 RepID=A0A2U2ARW3_9GAMM|nr:carbamoyl-phosphate synthase domain-containing protein [Ignatzschineria cameli]PWD86739.1 hypothetical protein DC080_03675 [Ignatzschineria cameli]PWD86907.1 hypothetical protein DC077_03585 [Ignatzschineria cameli]PWD91880.1 hypothetical protein DC079_00520 [Ignatzschineria cameli]PWD93533.1 hypothetical protein DC081_01665 [Ignatzschineria cameli]PWD94275.1 hypothetical protein DC078_01665 [Ignatzschineria cameli]